MSGIRQLQRWSGRRGSPDLIEHSDWSERTSRPRVLIENPDGAELWAHSEALREAGYEVAVCEGPTEKSPQHPKPVLCPILVHGRCALVEGADVVVSTTDLHQSRGILRAITSRRSPALVVEGPRHALKAGADVIGNSTVIEFPVTEGRLLTAVSDALAARREP